MEARDREVLGRLKSSIEKEVGPVRLILFGSRARGEAGPLSDMDVVVILDDSATDRDVDIVSELAWESGFDAGIVIVPVIFRRREWEDTPERSSLLAQAVEQQGVLL